MFGLQLTFPDNDCVPAEEAELAAFFYVALFVAFYLLLPELAIALWRYVVPAAFVSVPKTAVDKYCGLVFAQYYVWGTGQAFDVYTVAVAMGVQITSHNQLGFCILAFDARHALVPLLCGHSVCHATKILFFLDFILVPLLLIIWT